MGAVVEKNRRRPDFLQGQEIRLADGHPWTFPAPDQGGEFSPEIMGEEYFELIHVILEAQDDCELLMAELTLALFLFNRNYQLDASECEHVFCFAPNSPELAESQRAFHDLALGHLEHLVLMGLIRPWTPPQDQGSGALARLLARLRRLRPFRHGRLPSQRGEALP